MVVLLTTRPSMRRRSASDAMSALSSSVRSGAICMMDQFLALGSGLGSSNERTLRQGERDAELFRVSCLLIEPR